MSDFKGKQQSSKPGADDESARQSRRSRIKNNAPTKKPEKFTGINKSELQGIVICDELPTPTSRQYDVFYDALVIYGGSKNPRVRTALRHLKPIDENTLQPARPNPAEYTNSDGTMDDDLKNALNAVWLKKLERASKLYSVYEEELQTLFGTITGQLNKNIRDTLESDDTWDAIDEANDTINLIKLLRTICYRETHIKMNPGLDLQSKILTLLQSKQDPSKSLGEYIEEVKIQFDVVKASGGRIVSPEFTEYVISKVYGEGKEKENLSYTYNKYLAVDPSQPAELKMQKEINQAVDQAMLSLVIINGSNDRMHRDLRQTLQDSYARGHDDYPMTPTGAHDMLNQYKAKHAPATRKGPSNNSNRNPNRQQKDGYEKAVKDANNEPDHDKSKQGTQFVTKATKTSKSNESPSQSSPSTPDKKSGVVCVMNSSKKKSDQGKVEFCFTQFGSPSTQTNMTNMEKVYLFSQKHDGVVNKNWILLDSQATCNVICNGNLLNNIRRHPNGEDITIHCNAGTVVVTSVGDLPGFGTVWYHPEGIANCLSLALVSDQYRVTLDTSVSQSFFVHKADGSTRRFDRVDCDLYACDVTKSDGILLPIVTIDGQKKQYSDLDIRRATAARKLQDSMGYPSLKAFLKMIDNNLILNCPITRRDILIAEDVFGVNTSIIKGKTVRRQPGHVREDVAVVPPHILKNYGDVTLAIDVYHVNGMKFFRSISRHLMFRMTTAIRNAKDTTLFNCIRAAHGLYKTRGFKVTQIHGDNEFMSLTNRLAEELEITFHPVARGSHEPFIERDNRTSKERARCMFNSTPFTRMPPRMVIEMILAVDYWLNSWCSKGGVSDTIPPRQIITGIKLDAHKHCKFQFGDYLLAHNESDNTMKARATDSIFLRPTGHPNGGFYVFDLQSARRVHRRSATLAHMTDTIIDRVDAIAKQQDAPIGIMYGDSHHTSTILDIETEDAPDDDDASDTSYHPSKDDDSTDSELTGFVSIPSVQTEADEDDDVADTQNSQIIRRYTQNDNSIHSDIEVVDFEQDTEIDIQHPEDDYSEASESLGVEADESQGVDADDDDYQEDLEVNDEVDNVLHTDASDTEEPPSIRRSRRLANEDPDEPGEDIPRKLKDYNTPPTTHSNFFSAGFSSAVAKLEREHTGFMFVSAAVDQYSAMEASKVTPQYHVSKGLKIFGDPGIDAVMKELKQLHDLRVMSPCRPEELTREEVKRALPYLMFLKRKRCGKIKGRGCADGRSQREFISKDQASSPTVSLYALMLSCVIDAIQRRDVATVDIPGAFLQTPMPEDEDPVHLKLTGQMARLLASLDPESYDPCIIYSDKGSPTIFAKANKAIYGTLKAALLFWKKLSSKLKEWGFEANPYDICTVNKMIDGSQATIVWHVDDLKISHVDPDVVTNIIADLRSEFGKTADLTVRRGKIHDYLGMVIDYSIPGKVMFNMFDYLEDIIANLPEDLKTNRSTTSPAATHLFNVSHDATKLKHDDAEQFHHYVAKLLFASKRTRTDLQTAIAFLCTRVQDPDEDDKKKLIRVLGYLKETIFLPLVLGDDGTGNMYWYVDASFAVHHNMRSHTGGMLTFGHGAVASISTKQKLNTKSSTEAELVGVDDCLPFNIWCYYFLQHQGCDIRQENNTTDPPVYLGHRNILYQDNTSSIRLESNGKASSTKRTRHINIRYFMITDRVNKREIEIEYCPTEEMLADYFTKPVQGALFRKFRNAILGLTEADFLRYKGDYYAAQAKRLGDVPD